MSDIREIESLKFIKIGYWESVNNEISFKCEDENFLKINNVVYAFVDKNEERIKYIGKTTVSLEKRFYGYIKGHGQSTNKKNKNNILKSLQNKKPIDIYALFDQYPFNWGKFNINLAAGLEDSLIAEFYPDWNGGRTETETREISDLKNLRMNHSQNIFTIKLGETYFNYGYINPGVKYSHLLGHDGEQLTIKHQNNVITTCNINRTANGSPRLVRLHGGRPLVEFYHLRNFSLGQIIQIEILDKNTICIL